MSRDESLEELMAQFRDLEHSDASHRSHPEDAPVKSPALRSLGNTSRYSLWEWIRISWHPLAVLLSGLLLFIIIMVAIFRPKFLFNDEDAFLWKRYFITVFITYFLLIGTLWGLHLYTKKFFRW